MRLVLASASPRRADLLRAAGYAFTIDAADVDERPATAEAPVAYVRRVAHAKAEAVARRQVDALVLAADTCVVVDGAILGKPIDDEEAVVMLRRLAGRTHEVLTGVAIRCAGRDPGDTDPPDEDEIVVSTTVHLVPLAPSDIAWYVASGEPRDKAGAYAIQGLASRFVDRIEGSYSNVVGLPVAEVASMLARQGVGVGPDS